MAQLHLSDNTRLNGDATVAVGYDASFNDLGLSGHGLGVGGSANFNGFYYNPNFISFTVQPYYNRSQNNSNYQSITDSSGVAASVNIFSGSKIPGTITFDKTFDGSGTFGLPGITGLTTQGDSRGLSISWAALFPGLPSLHASFSDSAGSSSLYGSDTTSRFSQKSFSLESGYSWAGFNFSGGYSRFKGESDSNLLLTDIGVKQSSSSASDGYNLMVQHKLPLRGQFSTQFRRLNYDYEFSQTAQRTTGSSDMVDTLLTLNPFRRLTLSADVEYNDNLVGGFEREIVNSTGQLAMFNSNASSGFRYGSQAYLNVYREFGITAHFSHQQQTIGGRTFDVNEYGASASGSYGKSFLGMFTFTGGLVDDVSEAGNTGLSLVGSVGFSRRFGGWSVSSGFGYAQSVQTLLVIYTTSSMNYNANVRHTLGAGKYLTLSFSGGHSGIARQSGNASHNESYSSSFLYHRLSVSGTYSKSSGESILTPTGLVGVPGPLPPGVISPSNLIAFNGNSYSFGAGATVIRNLEIAGSYSAGKSNEQAESLNLVNSYSASHATLRYRLRKLILQAGYTRLWQESRTAAIPHSVVNSYYFGVSRWFSFF
jgi:hypothetical protein